MAKKSEAVRQRAGIAMGESMGVPTGTGTPRFKKGGAVDKTSLQKYGNGFRKVGAKSKPAFPGAAPAFAKGGKVGKEGSAKEERTESKAEAAAEKRRGV